MASVAQPPTRSVMDFPPPGSRRAPKTFSGKFYEVDSFLEEFDNLAAYYLLSDKDKFAQVVRYVTRSVRDIMEGLSSYKDRKWDEFKDELRMIFEHERLEDRYTMRDLKSLTDEWHDRKINSLRDFRKYQRRFAKYGGWLRSHGVIDDLKYRKYFWKGL